MPRWFLDPAWIPLWAVVVPAVIGAVVALYQTRFTLAGKKAEQDLAARNKAEDNSLRKDEIAFNALHTHITGLEGRLSRLESRVQELEKELDLAQTRLLEKERELAKAVLERDSLLTKSTLQDSRIVELEAEVSRQKLQVEELTAQLSTAQRTLELRGGKPQE